MKYLIVNSDDFGISEGVSRGIIEGHLDGIVTSTTTMINMPAAQAAIQEAQRVAPELGIGLHLNLSFGAPVSDPADVPSLVTDEGCFVTTSAALMAKMPTFEIDELEREIIGQFERFREIAGQLPTHLDSHHGATYYHPFAFGVMLRLAKEHHLPIRWVKPNDELYEASTAAIEHLRKVDAVIQAQGMPLHTDHFANFIFDFGDTSRVANLRAGLRTVQEGYTELMVHVGYGEGLDEGYNMQRDQELAAVLDAEVKQIIQEEGIQLVTFRALAKTD